MTYTEELPTVTADEHHGDKHIHPAFGCVVITNPNGHIGTLFGSDIGHSSAIKLSISTATLTRDLSRDWIHQDKELIEIEMSHAQFAELITSVGKGDGVPCTIRRRQEMTKLESIPGIKKIESKHDTFRNEIKESSRKQIEALHRAARHDAGWRNDQQEGVARTSLWYEVRD